ncbi:MAG: hypothetical protein RR840_03110 [Clostridium sp.]
MRDFIGRWKSRDTQDIINISKTDDTYSVRWGLENDDTYSYQGIGIYVEGNLVVAKAPLKAIKYGIGIYKPIGDRKSNSALWASTQNKGILGSGIAIREDVSNNYEGHYKVRYFINGIESPLYDLDIVSSTKNTYNLTWSIEGITKLHGTGIIDNSKMILAWGEIGFTYDVNIISINEFNRLNITYTRVNGCINNEEYNEIKA